MLVRYKATFMKTTQLTFPVYRLFVKILFPTVM